MREIVNIVTLNAYRPPRKNGCQWGGPKGTNKINEPPLTAWQSLTTESAILTMFAIAIYIHPPCPAFKSPGFLPPVNVEETMSTLPLVDGVDIHIGNIELIDELVINKEVMFAMSNPRPIVDTS